MQTGDLIFFKQTNNWYFPDYLIRLFTDSPWVHVGFILQDPTFLGLKGTYLWESDPTGGVQIHPFNKSQKYWVRKFKSENPIDEEQLKKIHDIVHGKPYDKNPLDWLEAAVGKDIDPQKTDSFWCSALVGCILTKLDIMNSDTDWSIMSPSHLANFFSSNYYPL